MTHSYTYILEAIQAKTLKVLTLSPFPKRILSASCAFSCACDATVTICHPPPGAACASAQKRPGKGHPTCPFTAR